MRHAILVLGMHRSGTSALTGMLEKLGVAMPHTLMLSNTSNERGYFESLVFMNFHEAILASAGSRWDDWRPMPHAWNDGAAGIAFRALAGHLLNKEFGHAPLFALKDPRICRFARFWIECLLSFNIGISVILPFRAAREVADSLAARDGMQVEAGLLLWLRHVLDAERATRDVPRAFVCMDELLVDWRQTADRVARTLGCTWPTPVQHAARAVDEFLSPDLKHQRASADTAAGRWAERAFSALALLTYEPTSATAQGELDAIGQEFEAACEMFGPLTNAPEPSIAARQDNKPPHDTMVDHTVDVVDPRIAAHLSKLRADTQIIRSQLTRLRVASGYRADPSSIANDGTAG